MKHKAFKDAAYCGKMPGGAVWYYFDATGNELGWAMSETCYHKTIGLPKKWHRPILDKMEYCWFI